MSTCESCGAFVTDDYVRVFAPPGAETVRVCPRCEDKLRERGRARKQSPRR